MDFSKPTASEASVKLLPGFKFKPTDEEIMMRYLRPRAVNEPVPSTFIVDVDILRSNPWDLRDLWRNTSFVKEYKDGHMETGAIVQQVTDTGGHRQLAGENTEWVMQEYSLVQAGLTPYPVIGPNGTNNIGEHSRDAVASTKKKDNLSEAVRNATTSVPKVVPVMINPDDSWVVCRIYKKKKHAPRVIAQRYNIAHGGQVCFFNFLGQGNSEGTSSSGSLTNLPIEKAKDNNEDRGGTNDKVN
ncbi:unnamed protein product [Miscanthus lutarioriparius]|uniref:NAC domain-containing protein n=1 Tax=Miscanthus lutarioriparius TaxID=422564 RepID=A0A811QL73_9POAL|nr:unnamed protein product [Miscanthus lutarioriparius]